MDLFDFAQPAPTQTATATDPLADELGTLEAELARHQDLYHDKDEPEISDEEYDGMIRRAKQIVAERPDLAKADSPTERVGAKPSGRLKRVAHEIPMLSLENAFSRDDVEKFDADVSAFLGVEPGTLSYTAEPKDDGLSCSLIYERGMLVRAATRGDKVIGEDVTAQARMVPDIPQMLTAPYPERIEVRGEVYMTHASYSAINARFQAEGRKLLSNCRNGASGALRQSDPAETARRPLNFFAYTIAQTTGDEPATQEALDQELKRLGFVTNPLFASCPDVDALIAHHAHIAQLRPSLGYDIDGVVYKVSDRALQRRLGTVSKCPRWAIAHKFVSEQVTTRCQGIDIQVGRTGKLTPVARLAPVSVGGVVVTNATLHNQDIIEQNDIRVGDLVIVQRAGDVIPQVVGVAETDEDRSGRPRYEFPLSCPECGGDAVREPDEADRRCVAGLGCPAQRKERLVHLASRAALDIDGLGDKVVSEFVDDGLVSEPADIFRLHARQADIVSREGWGQSSVANLLAAIERRRSSPLDRVLYSFGIRHVGETATTQIARRYRSMASFLEATEILRDDRTHRRRIAAETGDYGRNRAGEFSPARFEEELAKQIAAQMAIPGIGPEIVTSLLDFLDDHNNQRIFSDLCSEMEIQDVVFETKESPVTGKTVVFTGSLETMTRQEAEAQAEALGAKTSGSVSKKTHILVHGPGAGSKLQKAEGLGVQCMTEGEWIELIS